MFTSEELHRVRAEVRESGWSLVKTPQTVAIARQARQEYFALFDRLPLRTTGFNYAELQQAPIRKQNLSSTNGLGEPYAQALQSTYFPKGAGFSALAAVFEVLCLSRNRLTGKADDYGEQPLRDHNWNACRVHHYPRGGGFMAEHRDTHFPAVLGEMNFLQCLALLSVRGEDFQHGGGYLRDLGGNRVDLEEVGGLGAIVFFDGRIPHGVDAIDPGQELSLGVKTGRLSAVANLYQYRG